MAPAETCIRKRGNELHKPGLRPIWVPDTRRPGFAQESRCQSMAVATADNADPTLSAFLDAALVDLHKLH